MTDEKFKLKSDCPERVAFDMASRIWHNEDHTKENFRKEFIKLYTECLGAVLGASYDNIFGEKR